MGLKMNNIQEEPVNISRRQLIQKLVIILSSFAAFLVAIPILGALFAPFFRHPPRTWRKVGVLDDFIIGETVLVKFKDSSPLPWSGISAETASWVRRTAEYDFLALSVNCAHLGCPVRWIKDAELFLCPCHGGVYYKDGSYAAGPPPHGLSHYPVRVRNDSVEIMTSPIPITTI
jgi:menaquinol-cytochrome c reductase iron-sulfur subunit